MLNDTRLQAAPSIRFMRTWQYIPFFDVHSTNPQDRDVGPGNDPVLWPCFGVTHAPRLEDFPVMPVEMVGFHLKPVNFFDGNPGIDIPPGKNAASKCCAANGNAANGAVNGVNGH